MNHLLIPPSRSHPHPEIDYICPNTFTIPPDARFETYPQHHGFNPATLMLTMDFSPLDELQADSLMQEWLFFVLLADLFRQVDVDFKLQDFVETGEVRYEDEPVRKVVTTARLRSCLRRWYEFEDTQRRSTDPAVLERAGVRKANVFRLVRQSQVVVTNLLQSRSKYVSSGPFMFWIVHVVETIQNAALMIYKSTQVEENVFWMPMPLAPWPSRRMYNNGSCANHIRRLQSLMSNTGLYFASTLRLPEGAITFDHSNCEELRCKVNYLDRDTYEPKHSCDSKNCPLVGPDRDKVRHLLEEGRIPILGLSISIRDKVEEIVFDVLSSEEMSYTAISHVWSDGRGNLKSNTLPTCQIKYFQSILQKLSPSSEKHYFWMDTLCVPSEQPLRREAIGLMRKTYQDAAQVLVLDSSLELVPSDIEPEEILIRVHTAGWMRRLWTLQEGALARKLLVQFRESAINLHLLAESIQRSDERQLQSPLAQDALSCVYSFQRFQNLKSTSLLELIRALQWRSTSWQQDETVCLSILLDLDVKQIESTPPAERMIKFLSAVGTVPFGLAFFSGPRVQQRSFRWAPVSLMPSTGYNLPVPDDSVLALQTVHGLVVEASGLHLSKMPISDISWFRIEEDKSKYVIRNMTQKEDQGASWATVEPSTYQNPAIILYGLFRSGLYRRRHSCRYQN